MPHILLSDIRSFCSKEKVYARRYDQVHVMVKKDHVLIVEDRKGERFPVTEDNVLQITEQEYRQVAASNAVINELKEKQNTPANAKRVKVQEEKIKQLLSCR